MPPSSLNCFNKGSFAIKSASAVINFIPILTTININRKQADSISVVLNASATLWTVFWLFFTIISGRFFCISAFSSAADTPSGKILLVIAFSIFSSIVVFSITKPATGLNSRNATTIAIKNVHNLKATLTNPRLWPKKVNNNIIAIIIKSIMKDINFTSYKETNSILFL